MDPEFAFQFHKRMELERTRRLEYERVARERLGVTNGPSRVGWSTSVRRWWKALRSARMAPMTPGACCASPVACS